MTTLERTVYAPARPLYALEIGARVRVTRGGFSDETGTIRDVRTNAMTRRTTYVVTLDSGTLWYDGGSRMQVIA